MTIEDIAIRQECSVRQINLALSMAFLAPPLVKAAIEGRLPRGIGITELRDVPSEWLKQYRKLGLYQVFLLAIEEHAEVVRVEFGGEHMHPSEKGRGTHWAQWKTSKDAGTCEGAV
jgi:hypothetical protein